MATHKRKELRSPQCNTSANEHTPRGCGEEQHLDQLCERVRDELPHGILVCDTFAGYSCACRDGWTCGQALDAIAVEGAKSRPAINRSARNSYVTQFRVVAAKRR